ncbi:MAG: hypothetical protein JWN17_771 [Frankiales bacterium]|nr:hypothetical protein [Frankiales bacterium]
MPPVSAQEVPEPEPSRAARRAALLQQLADLRGLRERLHPLRTKLERERAALRRTIGRL